MTLSDQAVAVAEIAVNESTVMNTAATAAAVRQSTETDDQRDTANERRRQYRWTVCPKAFTKKGDLTICLRKHIVKRLYRCTVCLKAYACSSGLQYHRQHAHPSSHTALTNRQFNEQFVNHTTPPTPFTNYPSPPSRLPLLNRPNDASTILKRNDSRAFQNTTVHHNAEQPGNQQSTETGKFSFNKNIFTKITNSYEFIRSASGSG